MSYKTILVHVDTQEQSRGRVRAALALAKAQGAHLTGLGVKCPRPLPAYAGPAIAPVFVPMMEDDADEEVAEAKTLFDSVVAEAGPDQLTDWRLAAGDPSYVLDLHSRYADLVVIGQTEPESTPEVMIDLPDNLILESTRPVLIVPYIGPRKTLGETVLVAWDGGRQSARAVELALPVLKQAREVQIMTVRPKQLESRWPGMDLAQYLARHGIPVVASRFDGTDIDIDDVLLNQVAETGADLIVMGAYGHSRFRETILGGTTRSMLRNTTVPLLMAH